MHVEQTFWDNGRNQAECLKLDENSECDAEGGVLPSHNQEESVEVHLNAQDDQLTTMASAPSSPLEVFLVFLKLGLTSFGGPIVHLGYFRDEVVVRRRWIDEAGYSDLVALCQ
jgi:hypothetical protein